MFKKTTDLLASLAGFSTKSERLLKKCVTVDLLILDDFAFRKLDQKESECLYAIVDERLGRLPVLMTSNRPPEDWYGCFPDQVIGGAILDRMISGAQKIIVTKGRSYRKDKGSNLNKMLDSIKAK